jgi:DNA-binding GntR family transcriptional regulator
VVSYNTTSQLVHTRVREISGQKTAAAILERLRYQSVRYQFHVSLLPGRLAQGAKEHLDIVEAVIVGDPVAAERITREHFASVISCLHQLEDVARPSILPAV